MRGSAGHARWVISQDWATQLGFDAAAPWRTGALDFTHQATASGHFINARCYTSETERRSVLDSGCTTTTNTARTLLATTPNASRRCTDWTRSQPDRS
ncbi:hypothetical protein JCM18909_3574 [Cutibacterium acnes JCM 18909]|nr:hypothetical protein JCM18909_3574 [Cutibacterium acnes JCM 18909]GAE76758.1 hypothetical protein JCM18918_2578 [Cutibacterium acnes JCM 18918]